VWYQEISGWRRLCLFRWASWTRLSPSCHQNLPMKSWIYSRNWSATLYIPPCLVTNLHSVASLAAILCIAYQRRPAGQAVCKCLCDSQSLLHLSRFLPFVTAFLFSGSFLFPTVHAVDSQPYGLGSIVDCRISPPRFLSECRKRRLNQASFVLLCFALLAFSGLCF